MKAYDPYTYWQNGHPAGTTPEFEAIDHTIGRRLWPERHARKFEDAPEAVRESSIGKLPLRPQTHCPHRNIQ